MPHANVRVLELPFDAAHPGATRELEQLVPAAAVYHAASTATAGVLAARLARARGAKAVVTEHAVAWEEVRRSRVTGCHGRFQAPGPRARALRDATLLHDLHRRLAVEAYAGAHAVTGVSPSTVRLQRTLACVPAGPPVYTRLVANPTVLVCDDEPHILLLVVMTLRNDGYRLLEANDGEEALERARGERPDLIVLDAGMPRMNGFDVSAAIRADTSIAPQPYVLMLTAAGQESDRRNAEASGVDEFQTKPFSPSRLRARVREILAERATAAG